MNNNKKSNTYAKSNTHNTEVISNKVRTSITIDNDVFQAVKSLSYFNLSKFCNNALRAFLLGEEVDILATRFKIQELKKELQYHENRIREIKAQINLLQNSLIKSNERNANLEKAIETTAKLMEENYGKIPEQRYRYLKNEFGLSKEEVDELVRKWNGGKDE